MYARQAHPFQTCTAQKWWRHSSTVTIYCGCGKSWQTRWQLAALKVEKRFLSILTNTRRRCWATLSRLTTSTAGVTSARYDCVSLGIAHLSWRPSVFSKESHSRWDELSWDDFQTSSASRAYLHSHSERVGWYANWAEMLTELKC